MSTSTSCNIYWVNLEDQVTEHDTDDATCDSSLTDCTITGSHGGTTSVTCNSQLQQSAFTADKYAQYFCACGSNTATVPSIVNCADLCYTLQTDFQCNVVTLNTGFTVGSPENGVLADQCVSYRCDTSGTDCTGVDDGFTLWTCDNQQHDSAGDTSTKSYVCNCHGGASIPSLYQNGGQTQGTACGGSSSSSSGGSSSSGTSSGGSSSTNSGGGTAQSSPTKSIAGPGYQPMETFPGLILLLFVLFLRF